MINVGSHAALHAITGVPVGEMASIFNQIYVYDGSTWLQLTTSDGPMPVEPKLHGILKEMAMEAWEEVWNKTHNINIYKTRKKLKKHLDKLPSSTIIWGSEFSHDKHKVVLHQIETCSGAGLILNSSGDHEVFFLSEEMIKFL